MEKFSKLFALYCNWNINASILLLFSFLTKFIASMNENKTAEIGFCLCLCLSVVFLCILFHFCLSANCSIALRALFSIFHFSFSVGLFILLQLNNKKIIIYATVEWFSKIRDLIKWYVFHRSRWNRFQHHFNLRFDATNNFSMVSHWREIKKIILTKSIDFFHRLQSLRLPFIFIRSRFGAPFVLIYIFWKRIPSFRNGIDNVEHANWLLCIMEPNDKYLHGIVDDGVGDEGEFARPAKRKRRWKPTTIKNSLKW